MCVSDGVGEKFPDTRDAQLQPIYLRRIKFTALSLPVWLFKGWRACFVHFPLSKVQRCNENMENASAR